MKFQKKPVVIEAVQILPTDYNGSSFDGSPFSEMTPWLYEAIKKGVVTPFSRESDCALWKIETLEDGPDAQVDHIASPGDWIIRGVDGKLYPCKPDIFSKTYEVYDGL